MKLSPWKEAVEPYLLVFTGMTWYHIKINQWGEVGRFVSFVFYCWTPFISGLATVCLSHSRNTGSRQGYWLWQWSRQLDHSLHVLWPSSKSLFMGSSPGLKPDLLHNTSFTISPLHPQTLNTGYRYEETSKQSWTEWPVGQAVWQLQHSFPLSLVSRGFGTFSIAVQKQREPDGI